MTLESDDDSLIHSSLSEFEKLAVKSITPPLEDYLKSISRTGDTCYKWSIVKPLLVYKLERVLDDFMDTVTENGDVNNSPTHQEFQATKDRLSGLLNGFYRAPFTIQRILELLLEPNKHYKKFDKFSRGLEKVLSVVTTVDPFPKKSPTSLLPNTILNGNGQMRTIEDTKKEEDDRKRTKLTNGDMALEEEVKEMDTGSDNVEEKKGDEKLEEDIEEKMDDKMEEKSDDTIVQALSPDSTTSDVIASTETGNHANAVSEESKSVKREDRELEEERHVKRVKLSNCEMENEVTTTQSEEPSDIPQTSLSSILPDNPVNQ